MRDLTDGPIPGHLLRLAVPIAVGMLFQVLYSLVDLYFVSQLGETAIAGVAAGANLQYVVIALTQALGVGTTTLVAHAVGRKDREDAQRIFDQSLLVSVLCGVAVLVAGYLSIGPYMALLGADDGSVEAGSTYLAWFLPGMGLQFALVSMAAALRGTGIQMPTMVLQMVTVVVNAVLSPILVMGWATGRPMGVAGAGLATSLSIALGVVLMWLYFVRPGRYVKVELRTLRPRVDVWKRILAIGLPPGGEFILMFVYLALVYWVIRAFGAEAQAGFGVGSRVMQAIFLPAMAIAFATAPVAGQNVGAGDAARVRRTLASALWMGSSLMALLVLPCQLAAEPMIRFFSRDPAVIAVGAEFLRIISWNFVATGVIFTAGGMFQALGNTVPSLAASATRLLTFAVPAVWMATSLDSFELSHLWSLSVVTVVLQMGLSLMLLKREMNRRLVDLVRHEPPATAASA